MMRITLVSLTCVATCASLTLPTQSRRPNGCQGAEPDRRAVSLCVSLALMPLAAAAFDTPSLDKFDDPNAKAMAASQPNPSRSKQLGAAFYALTSSDLQSLKAMVAAGWDLNEVTDTAGKTA